MAEENPLVVTTRTAHMGWDEHRYFGRAVFEDLTGKESLTYLMALSILGRELPRDCYPVLDDAACALTLADPRIWPLKLTRLVASYGSTVPATAAGLLIEERARVGPWTCAKAAEILSSFEAANREPHERTRARAERRQGVPRGASLRLGIRDAVSSGRRTARRFSRLHRPPR